MNPETRCVIPADHPCLAGHFPGNPVVPAVVILDEVAQAFAAWRPDWRLAGMPVVKFLAPLRPDRVFAIRFVEADSGQIRFECVEAGGQVLARGCLTVARAGGQSSAGSAPPALRPK
ncbi:MAG TPA: hydroxymyristoyl-ACP dehydratase [Xanthomonadaceae bacterium]|nr:hydroxymyristoyl-ACP dehydratase [Xanthomonadaceae bacterium]